MRRPNPSQQFRLKPHRRRPAFTLAELLMGIFLASILAVILGGLTHAVHTAQQHTDGLQTSLAQSQAIIERVRWMISQAGTYRAPNSPSIIGLRVIERKSGVYALPDVLVVWSGGRQGGMADLEVLDRMPVASELVVYAPHTDRPHELIEFAFPASSQVIDFGSTNFDSTIQTLLASSSAQAARLTDRLVVSTPSTYWYMGTDERGAIRFDLEQFPSDRELDEYAAGERSWQSLSWPQSMYTDEFGQRQANVRIELQLRARPRSSQTDENQTSAVPAFTTVSHRYAYYP